ncbi:MAG TPA: hypothetical protein VIH03_09370 [Nitrososphaerales archaeon]
MINVNERKELEDALDKEIKNILADKNWLENGLGNRANTVLNYFVLDESRKLTSMTSWLKWLTLVLAVLATSPFLEFILKIAKLFTSSG